jgi:type VI secretion system protein ImpE
LVPPVSADELFRAGKLEDAIELLGVKLRSDPADAQQRTFLFELLCFAGAHDRADKQLDVLAGISREAGMGALLYRAALHAERTRQEMFLKGAFPQGGPTPHTVSGTLNGQPFQELVDADARVGARLEVFAAGQYLWLPFEHIATVRQAPPKKLRDLMWSPAVVRTGPGFRGVELGEVLLPVLAPLSWQHPDVAVRLGRVTEWAETDDRPPVPVGQKLLLVDGEEFPLLELRELDITPTAASAG